MKSSPPPEADPNARPMGWRLLDDPGQLAWLLQRQIASLSPGAPGPALLWLTGLDDAMGQAPWEAVATRLAAGLRGHDLVFRLGPTGLGAVLNGGAGAQRLGERLDRWMGRPYVVQGQVLRLRPDVVVARHGQDGLDGWDLVEALHRPRPGLT